MDARKGLVGDLDAKATNLLDGFDVGLGEVSGIDILVSNAGIIKRIPMCKMSAEDFSAVIDVGLNAPFIVAKTSASRWGTPEDLMGSAVFLAYIGKQPE